MITINDNDFEILMAAKQWYRNIAHIDTEQSSDLISEEEHYNLEQEYTDNLFNVISTAEIKNDIENQQKKTQGL